MTERAIAPSILDLDCRMETFHGDDTPSEMWPCSVRIGALSIVIEYQDDGTVTYRGRAEAPGHYSLECVALGGRATLHRAPGSPVLEGFWNEGGYRGMWRIYLSES
jgi:hypothetical protein